MSFTHTQCNEAVQAALTKEMLSYLYEPAQVEAEEMGGMSRLTKTQFVKDATNPENWNWDSDVGFLMPLRYGHIVWAEISTNDDGTVVATLRDE